jgi:uncharacterized protein (TIGR03000 family)
MFPPLCSSRRILLMAGALVLMLAAPGMGAPPGGNYPGALYPYHATPLYPAYKPSISPPGAYPSSGISPYTGYIPGTNFAPGFAPGFASSYLRTLPPNNPQPESRTRFYIPSDIEDGAGVVDNTAHLEVLVPGDATLSFNGWKARSTGTIRKLQSPPLTPGRKFAYTVQARWEENGREVIQTRQVVVSAGAQVRVNFLRDGENRDQGKSKNDK